MSAAAGLTVLAGLLLYWNDASGSTLWARSGAGMGFGIGAVFASLVLYLAYMVGRSSKAMAQLGAQFQGKPSDAQMAQMQALRKQQKMYANITAVSLILAVIFMSIARYFVF